MSHILPSIFPVYCPSPICIQSLFTITVFNYAISSTSHTKRCILWIYKFTIIIYNMFCFCIWEQSNQAIIFSAIFCRSFAKRNVYFKIDSFFWQLIRFKTKLFRIIRNQFFFFVKKVNIVPSSRISVCAICAEQRPLVRLPAATRRSTTATFIKGFR